MYPESLRAQGVKALQSPTTYFLALIAALILYYVDRVYNLGYIYQHSQIQLPHLSDLLQAKDEEIRESKVDASTTLVLSLLILSLVLALKKVLNKRKT